MKRWSLLTVGLSIYAATLLVIAPATLIDAGLQRASNGRLRLADAHGTVWAGAAKLEIRDAGSRHGVAKIISWRILPESAWRGRLVCEIELDQSTPRRFPVAISPSQFEITNADVEFPAAGLSVAIAQLAPLRLTGDVLLHISSLAIGRNDVRGNATLQWRAAGSAFSPVSPLGNYELRLDGEGTSVHVYLRTLQGPLQLDGKGSWTTRGNAEFQAIARVPPEHQQQLTPLLRLIAVQRDEGSFELQLK